MTRKNAVNNKKQRKHNEILINFSISVHILSYFVAIQEQFSILSNNPVNSSWYKISTFDSVVSNILFSNVY